MSIADAMKTLPRRLMRSSAARKAGQFGVYLLLRTGMMLVQVFPLELMLLVARGLGTVMFWVDRKHRERAIEHLTFAFGHEWSPERIRLGAKRSCQHMVLLGIEIISLAKLINRHNYHQYVDFRNIDEALRLILDNRGMLLVTGHFGNWELIGYAVGALGLRTFAVARPIDNPYIERWLLRHRQETGQTIISKFGATDVMQKVIEQQQPLCFVGDQHAGRRGVWVDFFGRPASTYRSIALLSLHMNTPIAVGGSWRLGNRFRFRAEVNDVIYPEDYADADDPVFEMTQRFTSSLERLIRNAPDQYLWMHRRWREPPPPRKKKHPRPATTAQG